MSDQNIEIIEDLDDNDDVFDGYGIIIHPKKASTYARGTNFPSIVETLERIGIVQDHKAKVIVQTCHILHRRGQYAILHYGELIAMNGGEDRMSETDIRRRNYIVNLLYQWDMIELDDDSKIEMVDEGLTGTAVRVLSYEEKPNWELIQNYKIGVVRA